MAMIKTKKIGVYYNLLKDGDKVFYFNYKDINDNNKKKWVKVGNFSNGYRESNAFQQRAEQLAKMKHGEDIRSIASKKENVTIFQTLAQRYFDDKNIKQDRINKYNNHIKPLFGTKNINIIKKMDIQKFLNNKLEDYAPATANTLRELITAIFNHSIKEYEL